MRRASLMVLSALLTGTSYAGSVDEALMKALRAEYPAITRWNVRPLGEPPADADVAGANDLAVIRLGSRSAVRANHRTYWYAVSGLQKVVSAVAPARAGIVLDAQFGRLEERDVLATGCTPLTDREHLVGMRAKRPLRMNDVICMQSIEPQPAVARGQAVTVRYIGEHVSLTSKAIAQSDGAIGDRLFVRATSSSDSFAARVSGSGEVTIHE